MHAWLSTAVLSPGGVDAGALRSQLGRVNSVVLVLRALAAPQPAPPAAAPPAAPAPEAPCEGDLEAALRLQQCLQVCWHACYCVWGLRWCIAMQLVRMWAAHKWRRACAAHCLLQEQLSPTSLERASCELVICHRCWTGARRRAWRTRGRRGAGARSRSGARR